LGLKSVRHQKKKPRPETLAGRRIRVDGYARSGPVSHLQARSSTKGGEKRDRLQRCLIDQVPEKLRRKENRPNAWGACLRTDSFPTSTMISVRFAINGVRHQKKKDQKGTVIARYNHLSVGAGLTKTGRQPGKLSMRRTTPGGVAKQRRRLSIRLNPGGRQRNINTDKGNHWPLGAGIFAEHAGSEPQ